MTYRGRASAEVMAAYETERRVALTYGYVPAVERREEVRDAYLMHVTYLPMERVYFRVKQADRKGGIVTATAVVEPRRSGVAGIVQELRSFVAWMYWPHMLPPVVVAAFAGYVAIYMAILSGSSVWWIVLLASLAWPLRRLARSWDSMRTNQAAHARRLMAEAKGGSPIPARPAGRDPIPARLRFRVLQRDGFRCQYCGSSQQAGVRLHVDHIVPVARGGATELDNLMTSCERCNIGKGTMSVV